MSAEENSTADVADALVASLGFEPTEGKKLGRKAGSSSSGTDGLSKGESKTVEDTTDTSSIDDGLSVVSMDAESGNSAENKAVSTNGHSNSATKSSSDSATKRSGGSRSAGSNRQNNRNRRARNQRGKQGRGSAAKNAAAAKNSKDPKAALADIKSAAKPTVTEPADPSAGTKPAETDDIDLANAETGANSKQLDDAKLDSDLDGANVDPKDSSQKDHVGVEAAVTGDLDNATVDEALGTAGTAQTPPPPSAADAIKIDDGAESGGLSAETIASVVPTGIDVGGNSTKNDAASAATAIDAKSGGAGSGSPLASARAKAKAKVADVAAKAKAETAKVESKTGSEAKTAGQQVEAKADAKSDATIESKVDSKVDSKLDLAPLQDAPVPTEVPTAPPLVQPAEVGKLARPTAPSRLPFPNPFRRRRRVQARKVRRVVRHIDPWSVLTFSVLFHLCVFAALLLASVLVWNAAEAAGTIENLETFITELGDYDSFTIEGDAVFRAAVAIAGILTLASSVMLVLLTVVFNLISDLVGGIRLTVIEEETVRVRRRKTKG